MTNNRALVRKIRKKLSSSLSLKLPSDEYKTVGFFKSLSYKRELKRKIADIISNLELPSDEYKTVGFFKSLSYKREIERKIANLIYNLEIFIEQRAYAYDNHRGFLRVHTDANYELDCIAISNVYHELYPSLRSFYLSFNDDHFKISNFIRNEIFAKLDQKGNTFYDDSYLTLDKLFRDFMLY